MVILKNNSVKKKKEIYDLCVFWANLYTINSLNSEDSEISVNSSNNQIALYIVED